MNRVKHFIKAALSLLLAAVMFAGSGISIYAENEEGTSVSVEDNLTWTLDSNGTLTISGQGDMKDYESGKNPYYLTFKSEITNIVIEEGVTSIGKSAFYGYVNMSSVSISDTVTKIGESAFASCSKLTEINIPDSVISIGASAFSSCLSLKNVKLSKNLTKIGNKTFYNCGFQNIDIPIGVTSIDDRAFYSCKKLIKITIPKSVTSISSTAFQSCEKLMGIEVDVNNIKFCSDDGVLYNYEKTAVLKYPIGKEGETFDIESGITSIGEYAFENCDSLTAVKIPESVKTIEGHAFNSCHWLTSINIPNGVTTIGDYAFCYCSGLKTVTISESVKSIGNYAFWSCTALKDLTIPGSVTNIYSCAFSQCKGLTTLTIKEGVGMLGVDSFSNCTGLTSVTIPGSVTTIGCDAFYYCTGLKTVEIKNGVKNIYSDAFYGCTALTEVEIPDSITSIDDFAFSNCTGLTDVTIGKGLKSVGRGVFSQCSNLTNITINPQNQVYDNRDNCNAIIETKSNTLIQGFQNTIIPESVTSIGGYAFYKCKELKEITIPESVTSIGVRAFDECKGLTEIIIPNSVISIDYSAFASCIKLKTVVLPENLTTLGSYAFGYCSELTKVTIPDSITSVGSNILCACPALANSGSIVNCGIKAFFNGVIAAIPSTYNVCVDGTPLCELTEIVIPDSVASIPDKAFSRCTSLQSITVSNSVKSVASTAFADCTIKTVYFKGSKEDWDNAFSSNPDLTNVVVIFVDYMCGENMSAQFDLNTNTLTVYGSGEMTDFASAEDIPWYGIKDSVKKVVFDDQPSSIGDFAFSGLTALEDIEIPDTVLSIGNNAFEGCVSLKNVTISQSITDIKNATFKNCSSLSSVDIPDSVTAIGSEAFNSCSSLANITLGDSVTAIGEGAFTGTEYYNTASNYRGNKVLYLGDNNRYLIAYGNGIVGQHFNGTVNSGTVLIADGAFRGADCDTVRLGNNIKYIGKQAFADSDIKTVYFPADVISYDNQAFSGCGSMTVYYDGPISDWYNMQIALAQGSTVYYTLRSSNGNVEVIYCDADLPQDVGDVTFADKLPSVDVSNKEFDSSQTKHQLESISEHTFSFDTYDGFDVMDIALKNKYSFIQPITGRTVTLKIRVPDEVRDKMLDILGYKGDFDEIAISNGKITVNGIDTVISNQKFDLLKKKFVLWHFYNDGMYFGKTYDTYTFVSDKLRLENGFFVLKVSHFSEFSFTAVSMGFEKPAQSVVETQSIDLGFINLSEDEVEFVSSNPEIASVNEKGILTAHKPGTVTVTAKQGGIKLDSCEITVVPLKCEISNYASYLTVRYKSTVVFSSETENLPDGSSVHWFINGRDEGVGDNFTVKKATDTYTVQLKVLSQEGEVLKESEIETVKVKNGFFDKFIAFFQSIFGTLPTICQ